MLTFRCTSPTESIWGGSFDIIWGFHFSETELEISKCILYIKRLTAEERFYYKKKDPK